MHLNHDLNTEHTWKMLNNFIDICPWSLAFVYPLDRFCFLFIVYNNTMYVSFSVWPILHLFVFTIFFYSLSTLKIPPVLPPVGDSLHDSLNLSL